MSDWAPDVAGRLEEIDRRLREIQAELVPGRVPRETRVPVSTPAPESSLGPEPATDPAARQGAGDQADDLGAGKQTGDLGAGAPAGDAGVEEQAGNPGAEEQAANPGAREPTAFEPRERPRGRSGPLAEALQRARNDRVAGLAAEPDVPSEEAVPAHSEQPLPEPASDEPQPPESAAEAADVVEPPPEPRAAEQPQPPPEPRAAEQPQPPPEPRAAEQPQPPPEPRAAEQPQPPPEPPAAEQPQPRAEPAPSRPLGPAPQFDVLAELQASLLTATRDLLDGYERASLGASERSGHRLTLSAGPFPGTRSLRAFEQELTRIPGVRDVAVRGYEGRRRAIIEVELDGPGDPEP